MNATVRDFYSKGADIGYRDAYELSHGPRLDKLVERYSLKDLRGRVLDVGGGLGFLGKRLHESVDYWVIDGAEVPGTERKPAEPQIVPDFRETSRRVRDVMLCRGTYFMADLDYEHFATPGGLQYAGCGMHMNWSYDLGAFNTAFCLETLEHCGNPHHVLVEIKKLVKPDGLIYLSVPPPSVWHNVPYCGLLWPSANFVQFLGQMALPVIDCWEYQPATVGWPATHYVCRNRPYAEKVLAFPKDEAKFRDATVLECTNL